MKYFLQGEKIGLRILEKEDVSGNYANWFNDKEVCEYNAHHRFPMCKSILDDYIENIANSRTSLVLAMIELANKEHIGNISLQNINYIDRNAEIAYIVGEKAYWGGGYATEASKMIISHAFSELGLERIYCGTSSANIRMQKLAYKLGFTKEGIRRKGIYKHGSYFDIIEFGLLKEEWDFESIPE